MTGVGAGGGGDGAPDFSRPQPESKGKTPGGARIMHHAQGANGRATTRARGAARTSHQAKGTETAGTAAPSRKPTRKSKR